MNILKQSEVIDNLEYRKIYKQFNFESIYRKVLSGINCYRFFQVELINYKQVKFTPKNDLQQMQMISLLSKVLAEDEKALLILNFKPRVFSIKQSKKILTYLHLDWLLALQNLKNSDGENTELISYLQFETNCSDICNKIENLKRERFYRSNIFTLNKNSSVVNVLDDSFNQNIGRLSDNNISLIKRNKLLSMIEVSTGFDNEKLELFLNELLVISDKITNKHNIDDSMKFQLKIRKIKRTYKKGMYIVAQNSIIIDPRYVDSIYHEVGHWYHTFFLPDIKNEKACEEFANDFMKKNKKIY
jgi:hypothetical protein